MSKGPGLMILAIALFWVLVILAGGCASKKPTETTPIWAAPPAPSDCPPGWVEIRGQAGITCQLGETP